MKPKHTCSWSLPCSYYLVQNTYANFVAEIKSVLKLLMSKQQEGLAAREPGCARSLLWSVPFADAIYDCSSLYQKNYRISGVYKLPPDDFLGSPELEVRPSPPMLYPCSPCPQRGSRARQSNQRETQNRTNTPGNYPNTHIMGEGESRHLFCPFKPLSTKHQVK